MIIGNFYEGSGLGNQLFRYAATRSLAETKGYDYYMDGTFKGASFMKVQRQSAPLIDEPVYRTYREKKVVENGVDIRGFDPEFFFVEDFTEIDGEFQDRRYWEEKLTDDWMKVEPYVMEDDVCAIGFRGGEYSLFPDLYLTQEYWELAIRMMRTKNKDMRFEVHTDDPKEAFKMFTPLIGRKYSVSKNIEHNWRAIRHAKYSIIANSSFYIFPRLLKHWNGEALTIAPRYWARRNTHVWALPQNWYKEFTYV